MNVAAVDISFSTTYQDPKYAYLENVFRILKTIEPPIFVIRWNNVAKLELGVLIRYSF